jgi:hypothetical protein
MAEINNTDVSGSQWLTSYKEFLFLFSFSTLKIGDSTSAM